jgi:phage gp36-like protein
MAAYLDIAGFKLLSVIPPEYLDIIESAQAGWTDARLGYWSRWIDTRLRKRYVTPFSPVPSAVAGWLCDIVTFDAYLKRGVDPTDQQIDEIRARRDAALLEIKEAADAKDGLFDLPLLDTSDGTGIAKGAPLFASNASPYSWIDDQAETGRLEDSSG